jgi:hypothetical protein
MMKLEPMQVLLLWKLVMADGEMWKADIRPAGVADNKVRKRLRDERLISEESLRREVPGKRATRSLKITLEDAGWAWVSENLDAQLPRSAAAADVLQGLLQRLQQYLLQADLALAEFLVSASVVPDLEQQIVAAYRALDTNGRGERVRIADLNRELRDIELSVLHRELLAMQSEDKLTLFVLDNPREITEADRRCEITTVLGDKRHIVYMESK